MKKAISLTIVVLASAMIGRAEVITQTVNFDTVTGSKQLYFSQFDTSLGTLTDVTLSWTINSTISSASITNQNAGTVTVTKVAFTNTVEGYVPSIGTSGDLVAEVLSGKSVNRTVTLNPGQTYNINNVVFNEFTQEDNYTAADANFNSFKGTGEVPLFISNTFGATPTTTTTGSSTSSWLTSITGSSTGNLVVTYTYTAAPIAPVPEPHSIALGLVGLAFVGGFVLKGRHKPEV